MSTLVLEPSPPLAGPLPLQKRVLIGGMGALAPVLLSLLVVDLKVTLEQADLLTTAGYAIRVTALFCVGAITAWLHGQEQEVSKLFQLGMAGPALLTTLLNGSQAASRAPDPPVAATTAFSLFAAPAHAQQLQPRIHSVDDPPPAASRLQRFLGGLLGYSVAPGEHFVALTGEVYADSVEAFRRTSAVRRLDDDFAGARVFRNPAPDGGYLVVIGAWVRDGEVVELFEEAAEDGLEVFVFTRASAPAVAAQQQRLHTAGS